MSEDKHHPGPWKRVTLTRQDVPVVFEYAAGPYYVVERFTYGHHVVDGEGRVNIRFPAQEIHVGTIVHKAEACHVFPREVCSFVIMGIHRTTHHGDF